ncbi:transcription factor IIS helical bundle-like domain-containing protein [uncultured Psychromonas sp.]|uniref:transcription factor IIS helical bundle-like domain-containing protein n=1 Tax=uncultured Psychromonas sp. TaxID=173974 RepID=UPI002631A7F9|nr:transcription factor IIS helical bundle-like domain-containing protein [uncultured Psychromonas sp.]
MNEGKVLKRFHSENHEIKKLISDLIEKWPHGYCQQIDLPSEGSDFYINIEPYQDIESTRSVIRTYMHLLCAYAPVCIDGDEITIWLNSGEIYREIEVRGKGKELAYYFWQAMEKKRLEYQDNGYEIHGIFMTTIANFNDLKDWGLYVAICRNFSELTMPNGCFIEQAEDITLNIQIALKPLPQTVLSTDEELIERSIYPTSVPQFLKKNKNN